MFRACPTNSLSWHLASHDQSRYSSIRSLGTRSVTFCLGSVVRRPLLKGRPIRGLIKTKAPKVECHRYPARMVAHFRRLFAVIRAYLDGLDAGRYVFRPNFGCGVCDFRETHCRAWSG